MLKINKEGIRFLSLLLLVEIILISRISFGTNNFLGVNITKNDSSLSEINIRFTKRPSFIIYSLNSPERLVIDVADSQFSTSDQINLRSSLVDKVELVQRNVNEQQNTRIIFLLKQESGYRARIDGNNIILRLQTSDEIENNKAVTEEKNSKISNEKLEKLQSEISIANSKLKEMEGSLAYQENIQQKLREEIDKLKRENSLTEDELSKVMMEKERSDQIAAQARRQLDEARIKVKLAGENETKAKRQLEAKMHQFSDQVKSLQGKIGEVQHERDLKQTSINQTLNTISLLSQKIDSIKNNNSQNSEGQQKLLISLQKEKNDLQIRVSGLRNELDIIQKRNSQKEEELNNINQTYSEYRTKLENITQEKSQAVERLNKAETSLQEALNRIEQIEKTRGLTEKRLEEATKAKIEIEKRLQDSEHARIAAENQVKQTKQKAEQDLLKVLSQKENSDKQAIEARNELQEARLKAKQANDNETRTRNKLESKTNQLLEQLRAMQTKIESIQQERDLKQKNLQLAVDKINLLNQNIQNIQKNSSNNNVNSNSLSSLQNEKNDLQNKIMLLRNELERIQSVNVQRESELDNLNKLYSGYRNKLDTVTQEKIQAESRLNDAEKFLRQALSKADEIEKNRVLTEKRLNDETKTRNDIEKRLIDAEDSRIQAEQEAKAAKAKINELEKVTSEWRKNWDRTNSKLQEITQKASDRTKEKEYSTIIDNLNKEKQTLSEQYIKVQIERDSIIKQLYEATQAYKNSNDKVRELQELVTLQNIKAKNKNEVADNSTSKVNKTNANQLKSVKNIFFEGGETTESIIIELNEPTDYTALRDGTGVHILKINNTKLPQLLERVMDVSSFEGPIDSISSYRQGETAIIEVNPRNNSESKVYANGKRIIWEFTAGQHNKNSENRVTKNNQTKQKGVKTIYDPLENYPNIEAAGFISSIPLEVKRARIGEKRYDGRRVNLDFREADIHSILRVLSDVGNINIIAGDDVSGNVTVKMQNVPWDQALEVILQSKGLGMIREGNIIRVAPLSVLEKEREMAIAKAKQKVQLAPLETRIIPLSYARASELRERVAEFLSERGNVGVDERTNVLIARDISERLDQIEELVKNLDTQTPMILIEGRIVEATSTYQREIGIQWGGDFSASSATGNPTGLVFPNSIGLSGGATDNETPTSGVSSNNPNFAVNLPATVGTGQGGAIGLTLGSVSNNAHINLRLSAMEDTGTIRIISAPRILTMDNREAHIEQGTLIPYSQISAQGVQTAFQEAKLNLTVTPHANVDGSVVLKLKVTRDEPDFTNTGARGDPTIHKREAQTELLVQDGHTVVIGGIFTRNSGTNYSQIPLLARIPILGWLFKNRKDSDRRSEMLIFITPRIVNRAESLGR